MRYLIIIFIILTTFIGCGSSSSNGIRDGSDSITKPKPPNIKDKSKQPPNIPDI
jgi:hypothetical protein